MIKRTFGTLLGTLGVVTVARFVAKVIRNNDMLDRIEDVEDRLVDAIDDIKNALSPRIGTEWEKAKDKMQDIKEVIRYTTNIPVPADKEEEESNKIEVQPMTEKEVRKLFKSDEEFNEFLKKAEKVVETVKTEVTEETEEPHETAEEFHESLVKEKIEEFLEESKTEFEKEIEEVFGETKSFETQEEIRNLFKSEDEKDKVFIDESKMVGNYIPPSAIKIKEVSEENTSTEDTQ